MAFSCQAAIGFALMKVAASHVAGRNALSDLEDGLHVILCGSGSPVPDPDRAGPCTMVVAGEHVFVVDVGDGATRNIARSAIPVQNLTAILITHFHSDHIDGLGALMALRKNTLVDAPPVAVFGPGAVEQVVSGFNRAYALNAEYRAAKVGVRMFPDHEALGKAEPFRLPEGPGVSGVQIWKRNGLTVTAFQVDHYPATPAVGYRFDYKGRSVVLSGDTLPSPAVTRFARGADILIHEALQPDLVEVMAAALEEKGQPHRAASLRQVITYHSSPAQAAAMAGQAGVKYLVLNHLGPPPPSRYFYPAFLNGAQQEFGGKLVVGEDGMIFSLPAHEGRIKQDHLF